MALLVLRTSMQMVYSAANLSGSLLRKKYIFRLESPEK
jgi:hypothetical protein